MKIKRSEFIRELRNGQVNVNDLSPALKKAFEAAGIGEAELSSVAGRDGQIRTQKEYRKLFGLIDRTDRDGSFRSILARAPGADGSVPTVGAEVFTELKSEVERNRLRAGQMGIIHLGMRDASVSEVRALRKGNPVEHGGVHSVQGEGVDGEIEHGGKTLDLKTGEGRKAFGQQLVKDGMGPARVGSFLGQIAAVGDGGKDEFAKLGLALWQTGKGDLTASRIVISGHSSGFSIGGDEKNEITFESLLGLRRTFPEGAAKIEHTAVSGCFSGFEGQVNNFREIFPNLKSYMGYTGYSPPAEGRAPADLRDWERRTEGGDASRVDANRGRGIATWNVVDGYQGEEGNRTLEVVQSEVDEARHVYDAYVSGGKDRAEIEDDIELDMYYFCVQQLLNHPDLPEDRRVQLRAHRDEVLELRHPGLLGLDRE